VRTDDLYAVQRRRELPTRVTQEAQVLIQRRAIAPVIQGTGGPVRMPAPVRMLLRFPLVRGVGPFLFGRGVRVEHVRSPEIPMAAPIEAKAGTGTMGVRRGSAPR
jgi:hypothetical protein